MNRMQGVFGVIVKTGALISFVIAFINVCLLVAKYFGADTGSHLPMSRNIFSATTFFLVGGLLPLAARLINRMFYGPHGSGAAAGPITQRIAD